MIYFTISLSSLSFSSVAGHLLHPLPIGTSLMRSADPTTTASDVTNSKKPSSCNVTTLISTYQKSTKNFLSSRS
ncbi:hypothetical protein F4782DRAFT_493310 [Xylaria castorea]|nr:hypothetical protein F4782DRAFT_493310 [Xylaria castorea]